MVTNDEKEAELISENASARVFLSLSIPCPSFAEIDRIFISFSREETTLLILETFMLTAFLSLLFNKIKVFCVAVSTS